jgi:3',5'-cyclic-AMP phosphodiesterase
MTTEPTAAQLMWSGLRGPIAVDGRELGVAADREAYGHHGRTDVGATTATGLIPGSEHLVTGTSFNGETVRARFSTPLSPAGVETARIATISDLHIGERAFGALPRVRERHAVEPYTLRAVRSAVREAVEWGASLIVVKGDLAHENRTPQYEVLGPIFASAGVPVLVIAGNHDGGNHQHDDVRAALGPLACNFIDDLHVQMIGGLRLVLLPSMAPGISAGRVARHLDRLSEVLSDQRPTLVLTHHHLQIVPWHLPVATWGRERQHLVRAIRSSGSPVVLSAGHSHRNRHHRLRAGFSVTEVGSTKDFPGAWAGYTVYEGGLHQSVHRISDPTVLEWTERTRHMLLGVWGRWSLGGAGDRSITWNW